MSHSERIPMGAGRHSGLTPLTIALICAGFAAGASAQPVGPAMLSPVVITASGVEQQAKEAPASMTVITREEIEKSGYTTAADAISHVEGVVMTGFDPNNKDITIRGLPGEYTLVLVDGRRQNTRETMNRGTGGVQYAFLPPLAAIERIEVARGPMSSLYGSEAMGGVINIITRKVPEKWSAALDSSVTLQTDDDYGNSRETQFWFGGPIKDDVVGLQVYGSYDDMTEGSNFYPSADGVYGRDTRSLGLKLAVRPTSNQDIVLDVSTQRLTTESTPGRSVPPDFDWFKEQHRRTSYGVTHTGRWNFGESRVSLYREESTQENWPSDEYVDNRKLSNTGLDAMLSMPFDSHTLRFGGQFVRTELSGIKNEASFPNYPTNTDKVTLNNYALFVEDDYFLTDDLILTAGVRMDHDDRYGTHWSPRLYGVYHVNDALTLKAGVSTGFKAPTIRQSTAGYCMMTGGNSGFRGPLCGNPDLEPETSVTQELGLMYDWAPGSSLAATLFHTNFKNKVASYDTGRQDPLNPGTNNHLYVYDNLDKVKIYGLELALKLPLTESLSLSTNYTFTKSQRKGGSEVAFNGDSLDGEPLEKTPRHVMNTRLDWQVNDRLHTYLRWNLSGEARYAAYRNGAAGVRTRPGGATYDVGGSYQVTKNLALRLAVLNITDHKRPLDERTRFNGLDGNWTLDEGRRFWLGASLQF
ncbi:TonB-dependent receptor [Achromobacter sp. F4_2707]|uniref:TonB-dependent receptor domain-containing protein n=1 Tax=Achromobacter sp. F4_2707 TaxID=3114286 RepID=UPI0039C6996E